MKRQAKKKAKVSLRYVGDTRYIIPSKSMPSGIRIGFSPGEVKSITAKDADYLLSIKRATGQRDSSPVNLFIKEI